LDSTTVFSQLSGNDKVVKEIATLVAELETLNSNADLPPDPRLTCISKIVINLAKCQTNIASAVVDTAKLAEPAQGRLKVPAAPPARQVPRVEISPEDALKKKGKKLPQRSGKKPFSLTWTLALLR
jgi:hypothetical protein